MLNAIKKTIIRNKAKEFLGDNIEILDDGKDVLVNIKHKKFEVEIQGIKVIFKFEEEIDE